MTPKSRRSFDRVVARFLREEEEGREPDRRQLLRKYPQFADRLQSFFREHDRLRAICRLAGPSLPGSADPIAADGLLSGGGRRFGDYQLLEEIDRGGMGIVFRARQISLGREVALKMLRSGVLADPQEVGRFLHEAKAAAALDHPGIVPVYEVGEHQGLHFFSMAYISGETLETLIQRRPVAPDDAARLVMQLARAVAYAHSRDVVHRDIKPSNVLVDADCRPHLTDFGLAKTHLAGAPHTVTGQILGTPAYMAPEQASGRPRACGPAADIYGLGATLYALLTGRPPFDAKTAVGLLLQLRSREPVPPRQYQRGVAPSLERICLKCMQKRPQDRYATADQVAEDLGRYLRGEPIQATAPGIDAQLACFVRRFPVLAAHWAIILVACALIFFNAWFFPQQPHFYLRLGSLLLGWAVVCGTLQALLSRPATSNVARWLWALVDVLLLTVAIAMAKPPRGPLLIGYPLVVVASGLFFRVRFVAFVTLINVAAFGLLTLALEDEPVRPANAVLFAVALAGLGLMVGGVIRHLLLLARFYEEKPLT